MTSRKRSEKKLIEEKTPLDAITLLSLPDQLRKTALALLKMGKATATGVSIETGRDKTMEGMYLKQLVKMGCLKTEKQGHNVYFQVS